MSRMAARCLLLVWPLVAVLPLAGCAVPGPSRHADAAPAVGSDEVPLRAVDDGLLASGQPPASQWTSIRARGVTTVINLRPADEMAGRDEALEVAVAGMAYRQLGIDGAQDLTEANAARIHAWIEAAPGPVLLHCSSGNRAGALLAVIAKRNGMPIEAALELGRRAGMTHLEPSVHALLVSPR